MASAAPRDTTRRKHSEGLRLCGLAWFAQADAMRLKKLHEMGGIYFDWDVSSLTHSWRIAPHPDYRPTQTVAV
jgi:hypothetical protein